MACVMVVADSASLNAADTYWRDLLIDLGYGTPDYYEPADVVSDETVIDGYEVGVVSESISSAALGSSGSGTDTPFLLAEAGIWDDWDLSTAGGGTNTNKNQMNLQQPLHLLHAGGGAETSGTYNVEIDVFSSGSLQGCTLSEFHSTADPIAAIEEPTTTGDHWLVSFDSGVTVYNTHTLEAARVCWGAGRADSIGNMTVFGDVLAERSIEWLVDSTYAARQVLYPTADTLTTGWTLSSGTNAYELVDDGIAVLTDYIQSANNEDGTQPLVLKFDTTGNLPSGSYPRTMTVAVRRETGTRAIDLLVEFREGYVNETTLGTLRGSYSDTLMDAATEWTLAPVVLTTDPTDETDMFVRIVVTVSGGGGTTRVQVANAQLFLDAGAAGSALLKIQAETEQTSETDLSILGLIRQQAETEQTSDAELNPLGLTRLQAETSNLADSELNPRGLTRLIAETLEMSKGEISALDLVRIVSETAQLPESDLHLLNLVRLESETVQLAETDLSVLGLIRIQAETSSPTEADISVLGLIRVETESEQISESDLRILSLLRIEGETSQLSEADIVARALVRLFAETLELGPTDIAVTDIVRVTTETLQMVEEDIVVRGLVQLFTETLQAAESDLAVLGIVRLIAETADISELDLKFVVDLGQAIVKILNESMLVPDAILTRLDLVRVVAETGNVTETILAIRDLVRVASEISNISETDLDIRGLVKVIDESASLSEVIQAIVAVALITDENPLWRDYGGSGRSFQDGGRDYYPPETDSE